MSKPIRFDKRLERALAPTGGWNPIQFDNSVAKFRCAGCGTLQGIGTRDMQSEFENKCPVCGFNMVFNRKPKRLDGRQADANKRFMVGNNDTRPDPLKDLAKIMQDLGISPVPGVKQR